MGKCFGQCGAISPNIGQYWAIFGQYRQILKDNGVISSSVKFVIYWERPIQVVPDEFFFILFLFCLAMSDTLRYDIDQNGRYRTISLPLRVLSHISGRGLAAGREGGGLLTSQFTVEEYSCQ